jgi:MazG family protein
MPNAPDTTDHASAGAQLERLIEIMRVLRSPEGCPWDREQTLESLRPFVLEEAYEVLDAIDASDPALLRDEIGDFVLEAVFLSQLCAEEGRFTMADSLAAVSDKLVRRHPHIFDAEGHVDTTRRPASMTSADVKQQWEEIKAGEQASAGKEPSALGGLPSALPGLLRAYRMGRRAASVGFDWTRQSEVWNKVDEEMAELKTAVGERDPDNIEEELGDFLFAVVNLARHLSVEPEGALRRASQKFAARFQELERRFAGRGLALRGVSADEMEAEWQRIKVDWTDRG